MTRLALSRILGLALSLASAPALSHGFQPARVELTESSPGRFEVAWVAQVELGAPGEEGTLELPAHCARARAPLAAEDEAVAVRRYAVDCGARGLRGARVGVAFPPGPGHEVLLQIATRDGRTAVAVLRPGAPWALVPGVDASGAWATARAFLALGVRHIAGGYDHLLFLAALALLLRRARPLALAVTAFAAGHSATLALAALGVVRVPQAPVEALIAGSIALLAAEVVRRERAPEALRLWALPLGFGLVHGLGFASGLAEAGLPPGARALALASFNLGVEAGQLAFVGVALVLGSAAARAPARSLAWARGASAYALGAVGAAWMLARVVAFS